MLLADIDDMKEVNEHHGHVFGDRVLMIVASVIKSSIRQEDVAARYGGDDFAILLPHTDIRGGQALRDRLIERIDTSDASAPWPEFNRSITFGVCQYTVGESKEMFIDRVDEALWRAKRAKRGGNDDDLSGVPVSI
jgi:diguanylate cyclase